MITPSPDFVNTSLGPLRVRRAGSGPPVVLWHSLFVDSRSWGAVIDGLAAHRSVIVIDGPCHGSSEKVRRDFTFAECTAAAVDALDGLGLADPVDWVGNAWGGHVGIQLAAQHPGRIRTLTTIGTPLQGLSARERWLMCWPLVAIYRLAGPNVLLLKALSDALIGAETVAAQPDRAAEVIAAFASADRSAMFHAMRSMMLRRPSMADDARRIDIPVLMLAARDDPMGWRPADAQAVVATMRVARAGEVAGTGHVAPLLVDTATIVDSVVGLWQSVR